MKRKCKICLEIIDDAETIWYSDGGVISDEDAICEFCYLNLRPVRVNQK